METITLLFFIATYSGFGFLILKKAIGETSQKGKKLKFFNRFTIFLLWWICIIPLLITGEIDWEN